MPRNTLANNQRSLINPYIYEAEPIDYYSMLSKGFAQQEERRQNAIQQHSVIKQALGKAREQLHQDPDTLMWFDQKANDIEKSINDAAQVGDYAGALNAGLTAAGDLANDASLNARIRSNTQYKEEFERQRQRVGKGISQATFDWWVKNNLYHYEDIKDRNGVIIGGNDWQSDFTPVDDLNDAQLALTAFKLLSPKKYQQSGTSNVNDKNAYTDLTKVDASSYEKVEQADILANMKAIIGPNGDNWRALRQGFNVALNELSKLESEYTSLDPNSDEYKLKKQQYDDQMSYFKGENGQLLTNDQNGWNTYYSRLITNNLFAQGLAYDWRTKTTNRIAEDSNKGSGVSSSGGIGSNTSTSTSNGHVQSSSGNMVILEAKTTEAQKAIADATTGTSTLFANCKKQ